MNDKSIPSRDFVGYADQPPGVVWPDEAQVAINFCINYEEGGELCISLTRRLSMLPG
jgi:allantoinase